MSTLQAAALSIPAASLPLIQPEVSITGMIVNQDHNSATCLTLTLDLLLRSPSLPREVVEDTELFSRRDACV